MTVSDATLSLLLAVKIHGTNAAVIATAKRCAQRLPRSKRFLMFSVMSSRNPIDFVRALTMDLDQWHARQSRMLESTGQRG